MNLQWPYTAFYKSLILLWHINILFLKRLLNSFCDWLYSILVGAIWHPGSAQCYQQAAHCAHAWPDPEDKHSLPVLLHPASVTHAHPAGLPQHVLHRHLLPQPGGGGHPRRGLQPLRQHQDHRGLLPSPGFKGENITPALWYAVTWWWLSCTSS